MRQEWSQAHRIQPKGGVKNVIAKSNPFAVESNLAPHSDSPIHLHRNNRLYFKKHNSQQNFRFSVGGILSWLPCPNMVGNLRTTRYVFAGANTNALCGSLGFICVQPNIGSIEIYALAGGAYRGLKQLHQENLIPKNQKASINHN